jgi:hypothetical protein
VGAVLADAHDPIDVAGGGIIAADGLGGLGREPDLTLLEDQPMRPAERAQFDEGQLPLSNQINDGKGVECSKAVVRDIGDCAVGGSNNFMRVVSDGDARDHMKVGRIDDGEGVILLG